MKQLVTQRAIDHNIFAVYTDMKEGNTTHFKFGNYDQVGIKNGKYLTMLRTVNTSSWELSLNNSKIGGKDIVLSQNYKNTNVLFETAFPYIYIPKKDFDVFALQINAELKIF